MESPSVAAAAAAAAVWQFKLGDEGFLPDSIPLCLHANIPLNDL
jgi:hypothetical protein